MTDILESAKEQLHNNNFSIVIVGENDVYTSTKHGVAPLLEILDGGNDVIKNSFVADKVVVYHEHAAPPAQVVETV